MEAFSLALPSQGFLFGKGRLGRLAVSISTELEGQIR
jgi:hypothetical protein